MKKIQKVPKFPGVRCGSDVFLWNGNYGGVSLARNMLAALVLHEITGITMALFIFSLFPC